MNIFNLIIEDKENPKLEQVMLSEENRQITDQLIREYKFAQRLSEYGLPVNHKVFLSGYSGCGKTMIAKAIAQTLGKPIYILNLSNAISSKIGETSQQMKLLFDKATRDKAVLFLDEFDQIGKARGNDDKDVGEMRRLVNTIIQLIDYLPKEVLLICATNHPEIIDIALLRRFQIKMNFEMPQPQVLDAYYDTILSSFPKEMRNIEKKYNISFAEAKDYTYTLIKSQLIQKWEDEENKDNIL